MTDGWDGVIKTPIRFTHRRRERIEAWLYTGQPDSEWPDWVQSHYRYYHGPNPRKGRWAVRDEEGYFWRWFDADKFTEMYEPT